VPEALSALVSKYLDCVIAVDEGEVENFLANFVPRTRVKEAIHALLAARELSFVHVGSKSLLQVTPPKQVYMPKNRRPERWLGLESSRRIGGGARAPVQFSLRPKHFRR